MLEWAARQTSAAATLAKSCSAAVLFSTGIILFTTGEALGDPEKLTKAVINAIDWKNETPDLKDRQKLAQAILAYWKDFEKRVPRLSPNESAWLEQEIKGTGERFERAIGSREFAIRQLNQHSDLCIRNVEGTIDAQKNEERRELEMFFWSRLLNCYDDGKEIENYLESADIGGEINDDLDITFSLLRDMILNRVLLMAMAETMDWKVEK